MNLSDLCRYYLRCLSVSYQDGVVVGQSSSTDYIELPAHPALGASSENLLAYPKAAAMANRARKGLPKKELMLGYPVCRMREANGKGWRDVLKPVFVWELLFTPSDEGGVLVAEGNPVLNPGVIASLDTQVDVMAATVALAEELGLNRDEVPGLEDLCARLRGANSGWPWIEEAVPSAISKDGSLATARQNGIYNRAIILAAEPSNFTKGLETELSEMAKFSNAEVSGTALAAWLRREFSDFQSPPGVGTNLLEPLPLNSEQREAIGRALSQPLTVITGPPGTGKSQVVSTLLINAALRGMRVIFSSKNNKAVDVVEQRVNELGVLPLLLRMGNDGHRQKLQAHLAGLLGSPVSPQDRQDFSEAQADYQKLEILDKRLRKSVNDVIELRNRVDRAEQAVEALRERVGDELFQSLRYEEVEAIDASATEITGAAEKAERRKQRFLVRLFWPIIEGQRMARLNEVTLRFRKLLQRVRVNEPNLRDSAHRAEAWAKVGGELALRAEQARAIGDYSRLLLQLSKGDRLEGILEALEVNQRDKAHVSKRVWEGWLRLLPDRLTEQARGQLADFASVLKTIVQVQADGGRAPAAIWSAFFRLLPEVSSFLPCWAVTALSAHKRFPFSKGDFDLLVIDESSQCDIAAIIPLLFRAKAVVIIGDPNQLQQISSLPAAVDAQLLEDHGLSGRPVWSYTVNSAYDLAVSLAGPDSVVELRDHHRSHADIIGFSDLEFYGRQLRIATDYRKLQLIDPDLPAIQWIDVVGQVARTDRDGVVNQAEAQKVLKVLQRLVLVRNYPGSIGVVTPFRGQANWIRRIIRQNPQLETALNLRAFHVDTAHGFQGYERDVMIFSPVVSAGMEHGTLHFLKRTGNVFNVAVTRARAGLIVVGNKSAARNSQVGHLARLACYIESLAVQNSMAAQPAAAPVKFDSIWEERFYDEFEREGIAAIPQYNVEKYVLDFAVFNGGRRLNIEIDGERYHRDWNGELLRRDQLRNSRLRELGWDVMRFWVYEVRDELDSCIRRVRDWLEGVEL
jgi:very-short-patch-repair endonuclease